MSGKISKVLLLVAALTLTMVGVAYAAQDPPPPPGFHATGEITEVNLDTSTFSLRAEDRVLTFLVTEDTHFRSPDGTVHGLEDLQPGMHALVGARERDDGTLVAMIVEVRGADVPHPPIRVSGEIVEVDLATSTFSLRAEDRVLTFLVTDDTHFRSPDGSVHGLEDLHRGMRALVLARERDDGTLVAALVAVRGGEPPHLIRASGEIVEVDLATNTFSLRTAEHRVLTFLVTEDTHYRSPDGSVHGLEDLHPGMNALVGARERDDGTLVAVVVAVRGGEPPHPPIRVSGEITEVDLAASTFSLRAEDRVLTFLVTEDTRFHSRDGSVHGLEDLELGMHALVLASERDDGTLLAREVTVRPPEPGQR